MYGYVIQDLSWQLGFWFASTACGLAFLCIFFFVPEVSLVVLNFAPAGNGIFDITQTMRRRQDPAKPSVHNRETCAGIYDHDTLKGEPHIEPASEEHANLNIPACRMAGPSFFSQLKVYNGTFSDEGLWAIFVRPFVLILSPVVCVVHVRLSVAHILIRRHPLDMVYIFDTSDARGVVRYDFKILVTSFPRASTYTLWQAHYRFLLRRSSRLHITSVQLRLCVIS